MAPTCTRNSLVLPPWSMSWQREVSIRLKTSSGVRERPASVVRVRQYVICVTSKAWRQLW
jgi:hypothetical protein